MMRSAQDAPTSQIPLFALYPELESVLARVPLCQLPTPVERAEKLEQAKEALDQGNDQAACGLLVAFINQVNGLISGGQLSEGSGQALIDVANATQDELGCP